MEGTLKAARPSRIQPTEPCSDHWPALGGLNQFEHRFQPAVWELLLVSTPAAEGSSAAGASLKMAAPPGGARARPRRHRPTAGARGGRRRAGGVPLATARGWRGGGGRRRHLFLFIVPQIADLGRGTAPRRAAARSAQLSVISGLFCWVGRLGATGPGLCQVRDFSTSYVGLFPVAFRSRVS